ncbi:involucrin-like [Protopterus annectens]|uniref:involucrin-like n=1 Tax=Protopterus annectens TaxID=7888 RepID=UPI001CFBA102|nr:involucrin-like [Protopterus annectens]
MGKKERIGNIFSGSVDKVKADLTSLESKLKEFKYMQNHHEKGTVDIKEDVFSLEKYIKQQFAELHQFLLDKEQQLIQQLKNAEANTLKRMEGNLECIKQEIVTYLVTDSDGNLEDKIKGEDSLKIMEENVKSVENDAVSIKGISHSNMEIRQQEPVGLLTEDVFNLEKYIKQQFAELHQFLLDKEQQLIQQLKNDEANTLKRMEGNLECIKQEIVTYLVTDSDGNLELKIKEEDSLKIMEENVKSVENDAVAIKGKVE